MCKWMQLIKDLFIFFSVMWIDHWQKKKSQKYQYNTLSCNFILTRICLFVGTYFLYAFNTKFSKIPLTSNKLPTASSTLFPSQFYCLLHFESLLRPRHRFDENTILNLAVHWNFCHLVVSAVTYFIKKYALTTRYSCK